MSVFNETAFLPDAIRSIIGQTFTDFEFLIVDDGSASVTSDLLAGVRDPRVRIVRNQTNQGLTRSLKRGVELSAGRYIARLDADDFAFRDRLEKQVKFMEGHKEVVLLGGACTLIDEQGRRIGLRNCPESDLEIRWTGLLTSPFLHPAAMFRRQVLVENNLSYDPAFGTAQDYDLWMRMLKHGQGANLSHPLIQYRIRSGATRLRREEQLNNTFQIAARTIAEELPGMKVDPEQIRLVWTSFSCADRAGDGGDQWERAARFYRDLFTQFATKYQSDKTNSALTSLRRRQAAEILRSMLRLKGPRGWRPLTVQLLRQDPWLPIWSGLKLAAAPVRKFSRSFRGFAHNAGRLRDSSPRSLLR